MLARSPIDYPIGTLMLRVESTNLSNKQDQVLYTDVITIEKKPVTTTPDK